MPEGHWLTPKGTSFRCGANPMAGTLWMSSHHDEPQRISSHVKYICHEFNEQVLFEQLSDSAGVAGLQSEVAVRRLAVGRYSPSLPLHHHYQFNIVFIKHICCDYRGSGGTFSDTYGRSDGQ